MATQRWNRGEANRGMPAPQTAPQPNGPPPPPPGRLVRWLGLSHKASPVLLVALALTLGVAQVRTQRRVDRLSDEVEAHKARAARFEERVARQETAIERLRVTLVRLIDRWDRRLAPPDPADFPASVRGLSSSSPWPITTPS